MMNRCLLGSGSWDSIVFSIPYKHRSNASHCFPAIEISRGGNRLSYKNDFKTKATYIINKADHIALGVFWAGLQINFVTIKIPEDDVVQVKKAKDTNWNFRLDSVFNVKQ